MSSEDLTQNGLRVGGWVPQGPPTRSGAGAGTVYRSGLRAEPQVDVELAAGAPSDGSARRSLGLFGGLMAAAALSLAGFVVAGNVGSADRVVGTMADPALPPVPPPYGGAPSDAVDNPGKVSGLVGSAAVPLFPTRSGHSDAAPIGQPGGGTPLPATPTVPVPSVSVPTPTPTPGETGPVEVIVPLSVGSTVSLESLARPGLLVRHDSDRAVVDRVGPGSSADERATARFTVRPGLADPDCVSFEADDSRRHFLRHRKFSVYLHRLDRSKLFARDATFCPVPGATGNHYSLRSLNYPERYLSVRDSLLFLDPVGSPQASTFVVRPPV